MQEKNEKIKEWDAFLAERFNTYKDRDKVHPDAAVNIFVGWPVFFWEIAQQARVLGKKHLKIFDFGCGAGELCRELHKKGHIVTGLDKSKAMISVAKKYLPNGMEIIHGDHKDPIFKSQNYKGKFDVVTSVHSLEWFKEIKIALKNLCGLLAHGGIIIFAVFPVEHVKDSLRIKDLFEDFDSADTPKKGWANFEGARVPVYIRDARYFDKFFRKMGFDKVLECYPHYPKNFFKKYNWKASKEPEMMIMAYRKH